MEVAFKVEGVVAAAEESIVEYLRDRIVRTRAGVEVDRVVVSLREAEDVVLEDEVSAGGKISAPDMLGDVIRRRTAEIEVRKGRVTDDQRRVGRGDPAPVGALECRVIDRQIGIVQVNHAASSRGARKNRIRYAVIEHRVGELQSIPRSAARDAGEADLAELRAFGYKTTVNGHLRPGLEEDGHAGFNGQRIGCRDDEIAADSVGSPAGGPGSISSQRA